MLHHGTTSELPHCMNTSNIKCHIHTFLSEKQSNICFRQRLNMLWMVIVDKTYRVIVLQKMFTI